MNMGPAFYRLHQNRIAFDGLSELLHQLDGGVFVRPGKTNTW